MAQDKVRRPKRSKRPANARHQLSNYFKKYPHMETDKDAFGADLHEWLKAIAANDKDLWFFCQ